MADPNFISGKDGVVSVTTIPVSGSGVSMDLGITEWDAEGSCDAVDRTNSKGAGFSDVAAGIRSYTGNVKCHWDGANNALDLPLTEGKVVALKCYLKGSSGPYLDAAKVLVEKLKLSLSITGGIDFEFSWKNKGEVKWPTGAVT